MRGALFGLEKRLLNWEVGLEKLYEAFRGEESSGVRQAPTESRALALPECGLLGAAGVVLAGATWLVSSAPFPLGGPPVKAL